jgi:hypothetical protein
MILLGLQIGLPFALAAYFAAIRIRLGRRNRQSWESLISRLQPMRCLQSLSNQFPWKEGLSATPDETWEQIHGTRGLWTLFRNAGVMMEIADFAARNSESFDPALLHALRNDAMQIRLGAIDAIAQTLWGHASERTRVNAFLVVSMYSGMASRIIELMQASASGVVPDFVAAM